MASSNKLPPVVPPLAEEDPDDSTTGASVRSITDFDLAATPSARSLPGVEAPPTPWQGGSTSVADVAITDESLQLDLQDEESRAQREAGSELGPAMDEPPPRREKPRYYTRPASEVPTEEQLSRRRFLRNAGGATVAVAFGWNLWRRRPVEVEAPDVKPAALTTGDFQTLRHAFEAILGDPAAAERAASVADLRYQRLGAGPAEALARDLRTLEMSSAGLLDGRRFTRLTVDEARGVLDGWARSSLSGRRRIRADLEHLARWAWAEHPATRAELGLG